jgi:hypothetical protein
MELKKLFKDIKKLLQNRTMAVFFLLIVLFGFMFGYYLTDILDKREKLSQINAQNNKPKESMEVKNNIDEGITIAKNTNQEKHLTENTKIIFERNYIKSNESDKEIVYPKQNWIGKNEEEFQKLFDDWEINQFNESEVIAKKIIDSYSPKYYKLGIAKKNDNEYIAIYNYDKEGQELIKYISDTPLSLLNKQEQNKIKKGLIFNNSEEIYRMLENYDG